MGIHTSGASRGGAWYIVAIFMVLLALSFLDRFVVALLVTPISAELQLSDRQMGLLMGFGFALLYSIAGVPIAHYLDRGNRVRGVAAGVLVWSLSTVACGFAQSFGQLLLLRAGVAIGEAVLTPAMLSLIADLFDERERGRPTTLFLSIGAIMAGGALIVGGFAVQLAEIIHVSFPQWAVWRLTVILVGTPGILLAVLLLSTVSEPTRRHTARQHAAVPGTDATSVIAHLRRHAGFYVPFHLAVGFGISIGYAAFSWAPTILVRSYGFTVAQSGYAFGSIAAPVAFAAMLFWGWLSGRIGTAFGPLRTMYFGLAVAATAGLGALLIDTGSATIVTVAFMSGGSAAFSVLSALIVQQAAPPTMHARLMAVVMLASCLIGLGLGPVALPQLSGFWETSPHALRHAMVAYVLAVSAGVLLALTASRRGYQRLLQETSTRRSTARITS